MNRSPKYFKMIVSLLGLMLIGCDGVSHVSRYRITLRSQSGDKQQWKTNEYRTSPWIRNIWFLDHRGRLVEIFPAENESVLIEQEFKPLAEAEAMP